MIYPYKLLFYTHDPIMYNLVTFYKKKLFKKYVAAECFLCLLCRSIILIILPDLRNDPIVHNLIMPLTYNL